MLLTHRQRSSFCAGIEFEQETDRTIMATSTSAHQCRDKLTVSTIQRCMSVPYRDIHRLSCRHSSAVAIFSRRQRTQRRLSVDDVHVLASGVLTFAAASARRRCCATALPDPSGFGSCATGNISNPGAKRNPTHARKSIHADDIGNFPTVTAAAAVTAMTEVSAVTVVTAVLRRGSSGVTRG